METLVLNSESPVLNDFLLQRKMKYAVYNKILYNVIWEEDALQLRKNFINNKRKVEKKEKPLLSYYLRKKLESLKKEEC